MTALPTAEPYFINGGVTGVLLIHGFMGLPAELRSLGYALAQQGYTVTGVLLARHGQPPEAMAGVRWQEWYATVTEAYRQLATRCEQVILVGYSLGGLLGLHLAAQHRVEGVITLAGALQLAGGWPLRTLPLARYILPWFYPLRFVNLNDPQVRASIVEKAGEINWDDPATRAYIRASVRIPTGAIYEIVRLAHVVRSELVQVRIPTLVLQGRRDQTVEPASAEQIMAGLGASDKQLHWFDHSDHLLPNGPEHALLQAVILDWLAARFPQPVQAG